MSFFFTVKSSINILARHMIYVALRDTVVYLNIIVTIKSKQFCSAVQQHKKFPFSQFQTSSHSERPRKPQSNRCQHLFLLAAASNAPVRVEPHMVSKSHFLISEDISVTSGLFYVILSRTFDLISNLHNEEGGFASIKADMLLVQTSSELQLL